MKKIIIMLCIAVFVFNITAFADSIYSYTETIPISKSIILTKVKEFHADRSISYSIIKADLTDSDTGIKLLTAEKGIDKLDTVSNLAKTNKNTVAALNADFFSWHEGTNALSLGIEIKDGKLLSSPINPSTMATVAYINNTLSTTYLDFHIMAVAPNGEYKEIKHLNKHTSYYGDILMYTSEFGGGYSPAPGGEVVEVVISGGTVTEFRRNMPPVEIPKDGCVLVVSEGSTMFLANNFLVGDPVRFDYYMTPDLSDADVAFGGGAMLVKDGAPVTSYSHTVAGNHPRSAIGTDKDGKTLYLVAVDGRQDASLGMRMSALANLLIDLGCYNAVNLDGGGSTNMVASTYQNANIHTVNSPTENRSVINAIGITYEKEPSVFKDFTIKKDKDTVFIGDTVKLEANAYDENFRPIPADVKWSAVGGTVNNGVFTATQGGKAIITATTEGITKSEEIYVIDKVSGIDTKPFITIDENGTASLEINVFDNEGHYVNVNNYDAFQTEVSDPSVIAVSGNIITALKQGNAIITIKKDDAISYISVRVGKGDYIIPKDNRYAENHTETGNVKIAITSNGAPTLLSGIIDNKLKTEISGSGSFAISEKNEGFSYREDSNGVYIYLNTSKGGIRNTDFTQWTSMVNTIEKTSKQNIFIISKSPIFGTSDFENKVLKDYLSEINKNIFVISGGDSNTYKNIDGVRYFTLANTRIPSFVSDHLKSRKYLEIKTGNTPTFVFKSIY